jgi:hypothetical protein
MSRPREVVSPPTARRSRKAWAVVLTKRAGVCVVFSVHEDVRDAESTRDRLREFGLDASMSPTRRGVLVAGMSVRATAGTA